MRISKKVLAVAAVAGATALALAGCSAGGSSGPATGDPIVVAANSSLTFFPEAPEAVKAVFDEFNAAGGLNGRPIEYLVCDDKVDPAASAQCQKDALSAGAVAMVGSSSLLDCVVNWKTWIDNDLVSLQGTGVDPYCFGTSNVAPANTGPFFDAQATIQQAATDGYTRICTLATSADPATKDAYTVMKKNWEAFSGQTMAAYDDSAGYGADYTANVNALLGNNCDAMVFLSVGPDVLAMINVLTQAGSSLPVYVQTSCYYPEFATAIASYAGPVSSAAEFAPLEEAVNDDFRALMDAAGVAQSSFAQGGYLAALDFLAILKSVEGEITAASVSAAAKGMTEPNANEMRGNPWIFGPGEAHQANASAWEVLVEPGTGVWASIGPWYGAEEIGFKDIPVAK
jgi:branched-chain amino acid transport system substrate-binding protein